MSSSSSSKSAFIILQFLTGLISLGITFGFSIFAIVVGTYEQCDKIMSDYLIAAGSIGLVIASFETLHSLADPEREGRLPVVNMLMAASLGVAIWGMTLTWPFQKEACNDLLYYTAFVSANMWWWILSLLIVVFLPIMTIMLSTEDSLDI